MLDEPQEDHQRSRRPRTLLEEYFATLPADLLRKQIDAALAGKVDTRLVLEVAALFHPRVRVRDEMRVLGHEFYRPLLLRWKATNQGSLLTLLPALQAYIVLDPGSNPGPRSGAVTADPSPPAPGSEATAEPRLGQRRPPRRRRLVANRPKDSPGGVTINLQPLADPGFDWSAARRILHQIDAVGEDASAWIHDADERRPHLERVNGLAFQLLKAVEVESLRRGDDHEFDADDSSFEATLAVLEAETQTARQQFLHSAEQSAQRVYAQGMLRRGALLLTALCGALGVCFWAFSVPAVVGIALPAGAIGAVISVFQRMHSGKSVADIQTAADRLRMFGALRTMIGGVFGMFAYALIESGLVGPTLVVPDGPTGLAYVGVVGFLAGFNERLAQDVITSSSRRVSGVIDGGSEARQLT